MTTVMMMNLLLFGRLAIIVIVIVIKLCLVGWQLAIDIDIDNCCLVGWQLLTIVW